MRNFFKSIILGTALTASTLVVAAPAKTLLPGFTPSQRNQLNQYMKNFIMSHPQLIMESLQKFQMQAQQRQVEQGRQAVIKNAAQLTQDKYTPAINQGPVTVVEFFDYQCSVCHMMYPILDKFVKQHPNVRVVFKEFPIFGPASEYAARASIAARMQGQQKFLAFHEALFKSGLMEGKLKPADVDRIAEKAGLNMAELKKDMNSSTVKDELKATFNLARDMQLQGTPAFVIMPTDIKDKTQLKETIFIPGGVHPGDLDQAVAKFKAKQ